MPAYEEKTLPLVSICIPTYNGSNHIKETLDSAINQSYKNIEIIITDDHSSDDTLTICESYAEEDSRIKVHKNEKNLGLVGNWCASLERASSKWVKFLFQDDLLQENCVERMIKCAIEHSVDFVICNREYFFEEGFNPKIKRYYSEKLPKTENIFNEERVYTPKETSKLISNHIFNNCIGEPPTFLFNKEKYSRSDFPDNYFQLIDYIFILNKILVHNFVFISDKLVKFRVHTSSESMKNSKVNTENTKEFHKFLYIQYYEKIQICYEILNNPIFSEVKKHIPEKHITVIKNLYAGSSYKRHGFDKVFQFYKKSDLSSFILDKFSSSYTYLSYKVYKTIYKKVRKKYKI
ncbi:glycosyltransferase family 2 protein [Aquimarina sp. MMG016]|uniref:glycosyltransferase family 2 protein n=1 Tax=Aquimarina sp. MMG016 TaxID=2822690 RepID=UPI001B3A475A|nr:glycosyltransferase family 2 protein [Aquimarina sp. MMG016]MBQ4822607.1 glycosyltransferase family 2 protein [Aquimarina sp. MMG016]